MIRSIEARVGCDVSPTTVDEFRSMASLLLSLRYDQATVRDMQRRFRQMRESITYQMILEEGRDEGRLVEACQSVLDIGTERFSVSDETIAAQVEQIGSLDAVYQIRLRALHVSNWQEPLALAPG